MSIRMTLSTGLAALLIAASPLALADDEAALAALLEEFLANVDQASMHDRFWADELVYTSSNGTRFGKETIMAGFETPADDSQSPSYSAEAVDIRLYDDMAIVAFELVGIDPDGTVSRYLNTGTFVMRNDAWKAIAWQATRIPAGEAGAATD